MPTLLNILRVSQASIGIFAVVGLVACGGGKKSISEGVPPEVAPVVVAQPGTTPDDAPASGGGAVVAAPSTWVPTLAAASSTVRSGESVEVTLTLTTSAGAPFTMAGLVVAFQAMGGTSTGTLSDTVIVGGGIFKANFAGILAGTPTTITATVSGSSISATLPSIAVVPGVVSLATSTVSVSQASIAAGSFSLVTVQPRDAAGNAYTSDDLVVALSRTSGTSTGAFSAPAFQSNGTHTATFTGATAGSATNVIASIGGTPIASSIPTITVTPGPASVAHSLITVSGTSVLTGDDLNATLRVFDAYGNQHATGGLTVVFTYSGGTSSISFDSTVDVADGTYTSVLTGNASGTATSIGATINGVAVTTAKPVVTVNPGSFDPANSVLTVSTGAVVSGATSTLTLTVRDSVNNLSNNGALNISFLTQAGTSTGTYSAASYAGSGVYTATFTGVLAGTASQIVARINTLPVTTALPTITVSPGAFSQAGSRVTVANATVASASAVTVSMQSRDAAGNATNTSGLTVVFGANSGTSTGAFGAVNTSQQATGLYTSQFTGQVAGTARNITATVSAVAIGGTAPTITVTPGPANMTNTVVTAPVGYSTLAAGSSVMVTLVAYDSWSTPNQLASNNATVVFSFTGGDSDGVFGPVTALGNGTYQASLKGMGAGTASDISVTYNGADVLSVMPQIEVLQGSISAAGSTIVTEFSTMPAGLPVNVTLTANDAGGNPIGAGGATVLFTYSGGTSTGTFGATTDNLDGTYTAVFTGAVAGTATSIGATIGGTPITTVLPTIIVTPGLPKFVITGYPDGAAGVAGNFTINVKDISDNPINNYVGTVAFTSTGPQAVLPANYTFTLGDAGVKSFSATLKTSGSQTITATDTVDPLIKGSQTGIIITAATPTKLYFGGDLYAKARVCSPIQVGVSDQFDNVGIAGANVVMTLSENGAGAFYSNTTCTTPTSTATVTIGNSFATVYYYSDVEETFTRGAVDDAVLLTSVSGSYEVKPWPAWIGTDSALSQFESGIESPRGRLDLQFNAPAAVAFDDSNFMYVADMTNHRIQKFDVANSYAFVGWIGRVVVLPTGGDAGCTTATLNVAAPGWCTGGRSSSTSTGDGMFSSPQSLYYNSGNLYVVDTGNHRIQRINTTTGLSTGWIGRVNVVPTGGDAGCTSAVLNDPTPGWCLGGTGKSGTGDGQFNSPRFVTGDGTYLYVADTSNSRVAKINMATGAYLGWFGRVNAVTTGGATGCDSTPLNSVTPGWCLGGTAKTGTSVGQLSSPRGLFLNGSYLYIADGSNHRIQRINISAAPLISLGGWIGRLSTAGTCGTTGNYTASGWCTDSASTAQTGVNDGMFNTPYKVTGDGTYLYVADYLNYRIQKINMSTAAFVGWSGRITSTSPALGGGSGCSGTTINNSTPEWCTGGAGGYGFALGSRYGLLNAFGVDYFGGSLYISDAGNYRVEKINPTTAAHVGYLSAKLNAPTSAWTTATSGTVHTGGYSDQSFYTPGGIFASGSTLYVADSTNHRVKKMDITTGAFQGWFGNVLHKASAGTGDCGTATNGSFTAGWCTGGYSKVGNGDGMLNTPNAVYEDGGTLYVTDGTNYRISKYTAATGVFSGWIGYVNATPSSGAAGCSSAATNTVTPGWCLGGTAKTGTATGAYNLPTKMTSDATYLYITDRSNHRVQRIVKATGAADGWIGKINSATGLANATGSSNCASRVSGEYTQEWCLGGTATSGAGDGHMNTPRGITFISGNLYVVDTTNHRVQRINASTGAMTGWIGYISTSPTGGDAGCNGAAASTFTPGWCTGGSAKTGSGDGYMASPRGIWSNGTSFYVTSTSSNRIMKYTLATGAFVGWMGNISTVPTAGDAGCVGSLSNTLTPGWCKGGTAKTGTGIGMLDAPDSITGSGVYLYVTDQNNSRVMRFPQ